MAITHTFVSAKANSTDTTLVRPSNWNDDHTGTVTGFSGLLADDQHVLDVEVDARLGSLGATCWVVASDAKAEVLAYAVILQAASYPVWVCDGTADDVQIQAAIDALPAGGGKIILSEGTFNISTQITAVNNLDFGGQGFATRLVRSAAIRMFSLNSMSNIDIHDLYWDGNTAPASSGGIGEVGNRVRIHHCLFDGWVSQHPVGPANANDVTIEDNFVGDCGGFGVEDGCDTVIIRNNIFFEATNDYAIIAAGNVALGKNIVVEGNQVPHGSTTGGCIDVGGENITVKNNIVANGYLHNIYVHDNYSLSGTDRILNILIEGNISINPQTGVALVIENYDTATASNIQIKNNYLKAAETALTLTKVTNVRISGNKIDGRIYTVEGSKQDYSENEVVADYVILIDGGFTYLDDVRIVNNRFVASVSVLFRVPTNSVIQHNKGYVTENSGTATVLNTATSVVVTHGLAATPTRVQVTPTLLSNAASFWVTAKGATTFVINVNADPGAGTATFDWRAQVGEG